VADRNVVGRRVKKAGLAGIARCLKVTVGWLYGEKK